MRRRDRPVFPLPAVHSANYILDNGDINPTTRLGWSVVATGYCHLVTDPEQGTHPR